MEQFFKTYYENMMKAISDGEVNIDEAFPEISRNKFEEAMASATAPAAAPAPAPEAEKKDELFTENK